MNSSGQALKLVIGSTERRPQRIEIAARGLYRSAHARNSSHSDAMMAIASLIHSLNGRAWARRSRGRSNWHGRIGDPLQIVHGLRGETLREQTADLVRAERSGQAPAVLWRQCLPSYERIAGSPARGGARMKADCRRQAIPTDDRGALTGGYGSAGMRQPYSRPLLLVHRVVSSSARLAFATSHPLAESIGLG